MTQYVLNAGRTTFDSLEVNVNTDVNPVLVENGGGRDGYLSCYEIKTSPSTSQNGIDASAVSYTNSPEPTSNSHGIGLNRFAPRNKHDKNAHLLNLETTSSNRIRSAKVVGEIEATGTVGYNLSTGHYAFTLSGSEERIINTGDINVGLANGQLSGSVNGRIDLDLNDYFVVINVDEPKNHHIAKITKIISFDYLGDGFEFSPSYGSNIPKGAKFAIYIGPPTTNTDIVAVGYGLNDTLGDGDQRNAEWVQASSPSFYFYNDRLKNKGQLDYSTKYQLNTSRWLGSVATGHFAQRIELNSSTVLHIYINVKTQSQWNIGDKIQNSDGVTFGEISSINTDSTGYLILVVTIPNGLDTKFWPRINSQLYEPYVAVNEKTVFMTKSENSPTVYSPVVGGNFVSYKNVKDLSPYGMTANVVDELENMDRGTPIEANINGLGSSSAYTRNFANWTDCFRNYKTSLNGKHLAHGGDGIGNKRHLYYDDSFDRNNIIHGLVDLEVSQDYNSIGNHANVTVLDVNDLSKVKLTDGDVLKVTNTIYSGKMGYDFDAPIEGTVTAFNGLTGQITVTNSNTDYDYNIVLGNNPYEQVKIEGYIFQISNISQSISSGVKTAILSYSGWRSSVYDVSSNNNGAFITEWDENQGMPTNQSILIGADIKRTAWSNICGNLILANEAQMQSNIVYADTDMPYLGGETEPPAGGLALPYKTGSYNINGNPSTKEEDVYSQTHLVLGDGNLTGRRFKVKFSDKLHNCLYLENVIEQTPDATKPNFNLAIQGFLKHETFTVNDITKVTTPTLLNYYNGQFLIERVIFDGKIDDAENGDGAIPQVKIKATDKSSELLNVKLNKTLQFTEDYIYSTNSPVKSIVATEYRFAGSPNSWDNLYGDWEFVGGDTIHKPSNYTGWIYLMNVNNSPVLFQFDIGQHLFKPDGTWIGEITEVVGADDSGGRFWAIKIGRGTNCIITTTDFTKYSGSGYETYKGITDGLNVASNLGVNLTDWVVYVNSDYQSTSSVSGFTAYDSSKKPVGNDIILGNAISANPFQSNRLDALTSCADKGVIFSSGKEVIRNRVTTAGGSSSGNKTTFTELPQTSADLQATSSDDDLQSLGYYINNPISISNNKDLEFMFKLSDEEIESTFNNIIYETKRTVSSLSEYEVVSVESGEDKKGIIKLAPTCPLILARVDLNVKDTRLLDEIPLWRKEQAFGALSETIYSVGDPIQRTVEMGSKFGGYIRTNLPLFEGDVNLGDLLFDTNDNFLGMINATYTNYEFETIGFDTDAKTLIEDRVNAENLKKIKRENMNQHGIYFLNTQGLPDGGFIQMLDEIKDPLSGTRMYNPPIPNRPEVAKDNAGNYIVGSNRGYLLGELKTGDSNYPYGRIDTTTINSRSRVNTNLGSNGDFNVDVSTGVMTVGDTDFPIIVNRSSSPVSDTCADYLSIGDSLFLVSNLGLNGVSARTSDLVNLGRIINVQVDTPLVGRDTIIIKKALVSFTWSTPVQNRYLLGSSYNIVGNLSKTTTTRNNMLVVRGGDPSQFFRKGDFICREDGKLIGKYLTTTAVDYGPREGEYVITFNPVRSNQNRDSCSLSDGERIYRFDDVPHNVSNAQTYGVQDSSLTKQDGYWAGYIDNKDASNQIIFTWYHKGAIEFFGETLFRYIDLQRGDYGSFNRLNKKRSYYGSLNNCYDEPSSITAYAPAFKVKHGYTDEPILIPYGYNIQNERHDWLTNPENKEGPILGSNTTAFAKGNFLDSRFSMPKSHRYEQNDSLETGGLYAGSAFSAYSAWADTLEEIDTKALHWQIFSISDLYPESVYHSNHIGYVNASHSFSDFAIVLKGKTGSTSSGVLHQQYSGVGSSTVITKDVVESLNIESSSINPRQIRRFGLMRLIEVTTDHLFNNVDGENAKSGASKSLPTYDTNLQIPYLHLPALGTTKQLPTENKFYGGYSQGIRQNVVKTTIGNNFSVSGNRPYIQLDPEYNNLDYTVGQEILSDHTGNSGSLYHNQDLKSWRSQIFKMPNQIIASEQGWILGRYYLGGIYNEGRYENTGKHLSEDPVSVNFHRGSLDLLQTQCHTAINYLPLDVGFHVDEHTREHGSTNLPKAATYTLIDEGYLVKPTIDGISGNNISPSGNFDGKNVMLPDSSKFIALLGNHTPFGSPALSSEQTTITTLGGNTISQGDLLGCEDADGVRKFLGEVDTIFQESSSGRTCLYIKLKKNNRIPYNYTDPPLAGDGAYSGIGGAMQNTQQFVPNGALYKITVNAPDIAGQKTLYTGVSYTMPITPTYTIQTNDNKISQHFGGGGDITGYQTHFQISGNNAQNTSNLHGQIISLDLLKGRTTSALPQNSIVSLKPNMFISNSKGETIGQIVYTGAVDYDLTTTIGTTIGATEIRLEPTGGIGNNSVNFSSHSIQAGDKIYDDFGRYVGSYASHTLDSVTGNGYDTINLQTPTTFMVSSASRLYVSSMGVDDNRFVYIIKNQTGYDADGAGGVALNGLNNVATTAGEIVYIAPHDNTEKSERFVWSYMLTRKTLTSNWPQYDSTIKGRDSLPMLEHFVVGKMGSYKLLEGGDPSVSTNWKSSLGLLGTTDGLFLGVDTILPSHGGSLEFLEGGGSVYLDQQYLSGGIGSWVTRRYRRGGLALGEMSSITLNDDFYSPMLKYQDMNKMIPYAGIPNTHELPYVSHVTTDVNKNASALGNNAKRKYNRFADHVKNRGAYVITPICFSCDFQRYGAVNVSSVPNIGGSNVHSASLEGHGFKEDNLGISIISDATDGSGVYAGTLVNYRRSAYQNKCDDPFSPSFMWGGIGGDGIDREGSLIINDTNETLSRDSSPYYQLRQPSRVLMRLTEGNLITAHHGSLIREVSNAGEAHSGAKAIALSGSIVVGPRDNDDNEVYNTDTVFLEGNPHKNVHEPFLYSSAIPVVVGKGASTPENSISTEIEKGMTIPKGGHYDTMNQTANAKRWLTGEQNNYWSIESSFYTNFTSDDYLASPNFRRLYSQPYLFGLRSKGNATTNKLVTGLIPIVNYDAYNTKDYENSIAQSNNQYNGFPLHSFNRGYLEGNRSSAAQTYAYKPQINFASATPKAKYNFLSHNIFTSSLDNTQKDYGKHGIKTTLAPTDHAYTKKGLVYFNWNRGSFNFGDGSGATTYHNVNTRGSHITGSMPVDDRPDYNNIGSSLNLGAPLWGSHAILPYTISYYQHHTGNASGTLYYTGQVNEGIVSNVNMFGGLPTSLINTYVNVPFGTTEAIRQTHSDVMGNVFYSHGSYDSETESLFNYGKSSSGVITSGDAVQFNKANTISRNYPRDISGTTKGASYLYKSASILYKWRIHLFNDKTMMYGPKVPNEATIIPQNDVTNALDKKGAREEHILSPRKGNGYQVVRFYTTDWNNIGSSNGNNGFGVDAQRRVAGFLNFFPDLTGYYLVSEEGVNSNFEGLIRNTPYVEGNFSYNANVAGAIPSESNSPHLLEQELYMDIEGSKPNHIHKVHYHEVHLDRHTEGGFETGKRYIHTLVIDNMKTPYAGNVYNYIGNYRIMRPAEVCIHRNSPTNLPLYTMSKTTTKMCESSDMYSLDIQPYHKESIDSTQTPANEGIFSMYLPVISDGPSSRDAFITTDGIVVRMGVDVDDSPSNYINAPENTMMIFSGGGSNFISTVSMGEDLILDANADFSDVANAGLLGKSLYGQKVNTIFRVTYNEGVATRNDIISLLSGLSSSGISASLDSGSSGTDIFDPDVEKAMFVNGRNNAFVTSRSPSDMFEETSIIDRAWTDSNSYEVLMTDGNTKLNTNITVNYNNRRQNSARESKLNCSLSADIKQFKKMVGIVSIGEVFTLTTSLSPTIKNVKSANIGSTVGIGKESLDAVKDILRAENIDFLIPVENNKTYFSQSTFKNTDLTTAIQGLLDNKNMRLFINNKSVTLKNDIVGYDTSDVVIDARSVKKQGIIVSSKRESLFAKYNEIIVQGLTHRSRKINGESIKKIGKKTLQEFDSTLTTKSEVVKKANKLIELHSNEQLRIFVEMDIRSARGLLVGHLVRVNLPKQGILNDFYRVMEIKYNINDTVKLELGSSDISLGRMIAQSLANKDSLTAEVLPQTNIGTNEPLEIFENIKVKEVRLVIKKHSFAFPNTGVLVNNGSGYASGATDTIVVDGVDATTKFSDGDMVYTGNNVFIGEIEDIPSATSIIFTQPIATSLIDNEQLWNGGAVGTIGFNTPIGYHTPIGFQAINSPTHTEEVLLDLDLTNEPEAII